MSEFQLRLFGLTLASFVWQGSRGLSLFYLNIYEDGKLNGIKIERLKEKLGTRAVPTAELLLDGARAHLVGTTEESLSSVQDKLICSGQVKLNK